MALALATDPHPYSQAILDALEAAPSIRAQHGDHLDGVRAMAEAIDDLPRRLRAEVLDGVAPEVQLGEYLQPLLQLQEVSWIAKHVAAGRLELIWRTRAWLRSGYLVLGQARSVSSAEREIHQDGPDAAPWWRIELSMAYWLLADDDERHRLLHHELSHLAVDTDATGRESRPHVVPHDVEEHVSTAARFGALTSESVALAAAIVRQPRIWDVDEVGQGLLGAWARP